MANPSTRRYPATRSEREHAAKNPVPALRTLSKRGPLLAGQVLLAADPDAATHQAFGVPAFDFVEGDAALWPFRFTMQTVPIRSSPPQSGGTYRLQEQVASRRGDPERR